MKPSATALACDDFRERSVRKCRLLGGLARYLGRAPVTA